ncbi:MAG: SCP2 sterol-binding domain-containing protein [Acidimicrobiales bacterium]
MATFLSEAWLADHHDPAAAALAAAGHAMRLQHVVTGAPGGEVRFASIVGPDATVEEVTGTIADPDLTLTAASGDALAMLRGEVSANVAYMRGRLKVAGHTGRLLELLDAAGGPAYEAARADLSARTET